MVVSTRLIMFRKVFKHDDLLFLIFRQSLWHTKTSERPQGLAKGRTAASRPGPYRHAAARVGDAALGLARSTPVLRRQTQAQPLDDRGDESVADLAAGGAASVPAEEGRRPGLRLARPAPVQLGNGLHRRRDPLLHRVRLALSCLRGVRITQGPQARGHNCTQASPSQMCISKVVA